VEAYLIDWFSVIVRWLHLITGIAWIGASLHFIWLDNSLEDPGEEKKAQGIKGELWSIHGGGIYNFNKYALAPPSWPSLLHWSKWEAYTTWITGTLLMVAVYYFQSQTYLVGSGKWVTDPGIAILASVGYVLSGLAVYELAVRSPLRHQQGLFVVLLGLFLAVQCWLATRLFSDRAAFLHVGALMGTIMAGNVFLGIIPAQKKFVAAVQSGKEPDPAPAAFAKQRSTHNNYFTLPVLFCMISNHYPFLYGHAFNWAILIAVIAITAYARHFFNLRHRGEVRVGILVRAFLAFLLLAGWLGYERVSKLESISGVQVADDRAFTIIATHCQVCHSKTPTHPAFNAPPAGILMDDHAVILKAKDQMLTAVNTNYMPLANLTGMTDEERAQLVIWLEFKVKDGD
jgi:uncharacterized membrane protein